MFKAMHMIGHRMMRLYDVVSADLPDGSLVEDELWKLKSRVESLTEVNERLERNLARLRRKYDAIQHEFEALKAEKIRIQRELERERGLSANLRNRLIEIERNNSLDQLERLRQENSLLLDEVKRLREELREVSDKEKIVEVRPVEVKKKHTDDRPVSLEGVKVALIGGVEGVDVVFCPVDINSHNASRYAKKACKKRGKPCYFLKSSGLSSLKRGLETFAKATA